MEILRFINEFGFCEIIQIDKKFNLKKPRNYKVMGRLVKSGLVIHKRLFQNQHGYFYLSRRGAGFTELPSMTNIPLNTYNHQLRIIDVYFKLTQQYPDAIWIGERRLKQEKFTKRFDKRKRRHIADGMLVFPDQSQVAIEVELTTKGRFRLNDILKRYASDFSIKEVWYYCSSAAIGGVSRLAADMKYIKVNSLREFLDI